MPKGMYAVINGSAKKIKKQYAVINGVAKKIKKMYAVVNGVAKPIFGGVEAGEVVFTASTQWSVPEGVSVIEIFCVGGGGGGGGCYERYNHNSSTTDSWQIREGSSGAGGYTATKLVSVTEGQTLTITVGAAGTDGLSCFNFFGDTSTSDVTSPNDTTSGKAGGKTSVARNGEILCEANGGAGGNKRSTLSSYYTAYVAGVNGGSGSGTGGSITGMTNREDSGSISGSDGKNGGNGSLATRTDTWNYVGTAGKGQGTTTGAFGNSNGTIYSAAGSTVSVPNSGNGGKRGTHGCSAAGVVIIRWAAQD